MKASSLQLERSAFLKVLVEAQELYAQKNDEQEFSSFSEAGLESSVEIGVAEEGSDQTVVKLDVRLLGKDGHVPPYKLHVILLGVFRCDFCGEPGQRQRLIEVNGPAVLYGSVRELVLQLTSRGPLGPLTLPTVTFLPPDIETDETGTQTSR